MPSCCAFGCFNRPEVLGKSKRFHAIPSGKGDEERRKKWLQAIGRKNWTPGPSARLCEDHFTADQYEQNRADGWKKLKPNAVPTIFSNRPPIKTRKTRKERSLFRQPQKYATNNEADVIPEYILWSVSSEGNETGNAVQMPSNVEVKASITDAQSIINKAAELSKSHGVHMEQQDTYFNVHQGHLKLRETLGGVAQLFFYERPDEEGPKFSNYSMQTFKNNDEAQGLKACLSAALGVKGVVKKKRQLFIMGNTRVHVDNVDGLGGFVELEVILQQNQSAEEGQKIAEDLMDQLGVPKEALICCSYIDLLLA